MRSTSKRASTIANISSRGFTISSYAFIFEIAQSLSQIAHHIFENPGILWLVNKLGQHRYGRDEANQCRFAARYGLSSY
jgi:hypothetical protein